MSDTLPTDPSAVPVTALDTSLVVENSDADAAVVPANIAQAAIKNVANKAPVYEFTDIVSGQFDTDEQAPEVLPLKRVLAPLPESPKLHKVLAQSGLGSRLEMEQLILEGRISVNNAPAHIGQRVQWGDQVKVNGRLLKIRIDPPPARVIAYHKPTGEVVTHDDPQNRPTVFRRLPKLYQGKWQSVGRLDLNTEGLLLFTNSGELANRLMHPRFGLEREYAVRVLGALNNEEKKKLLDGVQLDDGIAQFGSIEEGGGEGSNHWYRVTISEGRNREVRRMIESVGHAVSRLIRIRYGAMMLPRGLKRGAHMELDDADIRALVHAAGPSRSHTPGDGTEPVLDDANRRTDNGRGTTRGPRNLRNGRRNQNSNRPYGPRLENPQNGSAPPMQDRVAPTQESYDSEEDNHSQAGVSHESGFARPARRNNRSGPGGGNYKGANKNTKQGNGQPDPMRTSQGYIGADSLQRQRSAPPGGGGRSGGRGGPRGRSGGR